MGYYDDYEEMREEMVDDDFREDPYDKDEDPEDEGDDRDPLDDEDLIDGVGFADPGDNSSLRAATENNPRNLPCPQCGAPNRLTPLDRAAGYQCNRCSDNLESGRGG